MQEIGERERTCYCGELDRKLIGTEIVVMGWVDRIRDLGNLIFVDLRDRTGIVQIVASSGQQEILKVAKEIRPEYVIAVAGKVTERDPETVNPDIPTGTVEVRAEQIEVLNTSNTPPFPINEEISTSEETRLRYRFLDLRRRSLQKNIVLRHEMTLATRNHLSKSGFYEIETPFLTKSTPEGARDYLVPSRVQRGHFYALPQSPQLFKQLLMVSGFDRYFQIVRCFRDEDLRADRQPEFTQVDIELSFPTFETLFTLVESLLKIMFATADIPVEAPFPRLAYADSINRFGTDRPDTRFGLELCDVTKAFTASSFQVFRRIIEEGGCVKGFLAPTGPRYSRKEIDDLGEFVQQYGAPAVSWIHSDAEGLRSSLPKVVSESELSRAAELAELGQDQTLLMLAGKPKVVHDALAALRLHIAQRHSLIPEGQWNFLWIYDFPLLEWDEEEDRFTALHHPFTSPRDEDAEFLTTDPTRVKAKAYDVVLNGIEIGGGSIRIHREEIQKQVFDALGIPEQEARERFGFLLDALRFGAPPHGGIALGLDRIVMLAAGERSIREVIAFPKTARGLDLMCAAPSTVSERQLRDLHIQLKGH